MVFHIFEYNVANINISEEDIFAFLDCYCSWTLAIKGIFAISSTHARLNQFSVAGLKYRGAI